ncbi:uncharacterized protein LOC133284853 [Gastrolobium bilobum]|uniref:uncharacterized protein LOC133284853 n=1 Tax=Gastrolobium bilobum TaxID=150636 RepID=UPI002AAFE15F|nr:uncharacterized protein LOC133284853 [Gastrolobium bilobum]
MSRKLNYGLKPKKSHLSYADLHHEITKSEEDNSLKSYGNQQRQATCGKASEEDELVKYMSSLPGYLERGEKIPEKVLNVGVLDWFRLEQWQHSHKYVPHRSSRSSTSTSATSSSVSNEGLSGNSSGGHSWSPSHQRIFRPSLQSHLMGSSIQDHSKPVKSSGGSVGTCQNLRGWHSNIDTESKYVRAGDPLSKNHRASILKGCDRKHLYPHINKESDILPNDRMYEAASCAKLRMSTQDGAMEKKVENLREHDVDTVEQGMLGKSKPIVLILPRDIPQNSHCGAPDMRTSLGQKLGSPSRARFSEKPTEPSCRYLNSEISHSCPVPDELIGSHSHPKGSGSSSIDLENNKVPAPTLTAPLPVRMGISPCRSRKVEERKHTIATSSSSNRPPKGLDQKVTTEKSRSSSPFRRFSFSIGFTNKGSGCKEVSHVPHQSSIAALKSSSENARGYASSNISGKDKSGDAGKSRSSPLRRLLDPLLKPKATNVHHSKESSQKDSLLVNKNCRSGNGKFSTLLPEKELDRDQRVGCTITNTADLSKDKKYVPSMCQALLSISVKNGQPRFTFAVDNNGNILAATVKNLTVSRKDECNCIYTFFTFKEVKKKNGSWMSQAGKSKGPDYVHRVVAQMKVSDSYNYDSTSQNCVNSSTTKEFVLFSVKLKQGDAQVTDYQPDDELAAIVVKSPKPINFINYAHQSGCQNDSQDLLHVTVVLPSGVHSLPSNGGPSSLIERWKTGGSCDCGGWDLACKLKILANENQACRKSRTSKAYFADQFELFIEGNDQDQENQRAFSFSHFKPGVYSVAFDASLSLLQAFSICIALVDGKIPYELSESRNSIQGKNLRETLLVQTDELKAFGKFEDIPASYVAYPPHSPVGRV